MPLEEFPTLAYWCEETKPHNSHFNPSSYVKCDGYDERFDYDAPKWCLIETPHKAHRSRNRFGGYNECSGIAESVQQRSQMHPTAVRLIVASLEGSAGMSLDAQAYLIQDVLERHGFEIKKVEVAQ